MIWLHLHYKETHLIRSASSHMSTCTKVADYMITRDQASYLPTCCTLECVMPKLFTADDVGWLIVKVDINNNQGHGFDKLKTLLGLML